jgi:FixJ family two-component response regulator
MLTDVVLPGKNGRELADEVARRRPEVKVVFMTGYSRNAIVHQGRLDPGTELISKPLIEATVARKIRQVLDAPRRG